MNGPHPFDTLGVDPWPGEPCPGDNPRISTLGVYFDAAYVRERRRGGVIVRELVHLPRCRVTGALGGSLVTSDPMRLAYEARRLLAAADILAHARDAHDRDNPPADLLEALR